MFRMVMKMMAKKITKEVFIYKNTQSDCFLKQFVTDSKADKKAALGMAVDVLLGGVDTVIIILLLNNIHSN